MHLEALIKQRIRAHGPITIADYMELALAHPEYGYYMHHDPLGAQGDFITAPEISQIFGELIGAWLAQQWLVMGKPNAALVELGPGRGTLMADALRATRHIAGFHDAISVHLVETSPVLQQKQQETLAGKHTRLHWHASFDTIPSQPLLLIANEFFDALPIRQFVCAPSPLEGEGRGEGYVERMIGLDDNGYLHFVSSIGDATPFIQRFTPPSPSRGEGIYELCELTIGIAQSIGAHIAAHGGAALIIDYGYTGGSRGDTLQALKQHRYHPVLEAPGSADLTAHVDFDALARAARQAGAQVYGPVAQGAFLHRLGAAARLEALVKNADAQQKSTMLSAMHRLTSPQAMGELFKVLCIAHPQHPTPEGFSR